MIKISSPPCPHYDSFSGAVILSCLLGNVPVMILDASLIVAIGSIDNICLMQHLTT
jgi:hypothetical protein